MQRRSILRLGAAGLGAAVLPMPALALTESEAREHVRAAIDAVLELARSPGTPEEKAPRLRAVLENRAAMPQIAKFAAGIAWREMNDQQRQRYTDAFVDFISRVYARRFEEYSGQTVEISGVVDAGRRGLLVESRVTQPEGEPVKVDWLVSDRPGRVVIADIVIEGVSLLVTQREEIGGMLEARNGNIDKLIDALRTA